MEVAGGIMCIGVVEGQKRTLSYEERSEMVETSSPYACSED